MKRHLTLLSCLGSLLLPAAALMAQEETELTLQLTSARNDDIDFNTATQTLGLKGVTPYGLVTCDSGYETGKTRIDTFDDVFGIAAVLNAPWNGYDARRLKCGYGLKLPLGGGELSGGLGIMRYDGQTDSVIDGKEIELDAMRLQGKYLHGRYTTRIELVDSHYDFLYHHLAGYDSDTAGHVRRLKLVGEWGPVYAEAEDLQGHKAKTFTTVLFPDADFDYRQTTLSLGPAFTAAMGPLRYIAPTYTTGSERGSFNELQLDGGIRGAVVGMAFGESKLRLRYLDLNSQGRRNYAPVTSDLAETQHSTTLALELEAGQWSAKLENNRHDHHGLITLDNVTVAPGVVLPYAGIVGCGTPPCDYNNSRSESEWKLSGQYRYSPLIALQGELYQRERADQQYEEAGHHYRESGGSLGIAVTF